MNERPRWLTQTPRLIPIAPNLMRLADPVSWVDCKGIVYDVPVGFITDGASLPWIITALWDRWDHRTIQASILHDYGYSTHKLGTKEEVDLRFYEGLIASKWSKARTYYKAVKWMGWYAWNIQRNTKQYEISID